MLNQDTLMLYLQNPLIKPLLEFMFKILFTESFQELTEDRPTVSPISGLIKCLKQFRFQLRLNPS